ncbi:PREDICTED: amiloride-sensitive sodium channel subunit delta [Ficedula albicollis]|uniref:amiloride-sensitive sodium channel subunit delta n=1 Tax=Ficedula albicollis TaxID=59894 RepID=UPI0007AD91EA|nr:PREDICTED: amiloride-sensitive sodium channel subunit delta [Ficedula albicollis]
MELPPEETLRQEGLIEFYGSFREMFEFFCKNTTIHGTIRLVCSGSTRGKRALWTLLLLASFGMLYWQFALMFSQFWSYPVVLTMSMHSEPKMFPAVTVCNRDPYRFELVREHLEQLDRMAEESLRFLYGSSFSRGKERNGNGNGNGNLSSSRFQLSPNFSLVRVAQIRAGRKHSSVGFQLCNSTGGNCFFKTYSSGLDAILEWYRFHYMNIMAQLPLAMNDSEHQEHLQDMVYSCQYDGEPCRPSDFVHFHHPIFGSCYTFNSKGTDPFWTATKPGIPYGLSLLLRAQQRGQLPLLSPVAGVRVLIHRHNQSPFLEHEGFDIRPGITTTIGIRQDEVNRLGGNYGRCTTDGADVAVELLYNNSYTLQACLHSCFQQLMLQECGCGYYYYPLPAGARPCDYSRHPGWGHCFYQLYSRLRNHRLNCFEQCPKPCRESLYKVSAGTAKWPSAKSQDWVRQALRHQNGYNSSSSRKGKKAPKAKAPRASPWLKVGFLQENLLLSSMGSQWSLWFGSSVLSVVEMLELLLDTLVLSLLFCLQRFRSRSHPGGPAPTPETHLELGEGQPAPGIPGIPRRRGVGGGEEQDLGQGLGQELRTEGV